MLSSTAEREPDESLKLMSFTSPARSKHSLNNALRDPENLNIPRVLCGKNKALTENLSNPGRYLQKVNGKFRIGTRPSEKCMTVSVE